MFENFYLNVERLHSDAKVPTRSHDTDAGLDVYTPYDVVIDPWSDVVIGLGWRCEFPKGYALIGQEKSGIAAKKKLDVGSKIIDSNYRGEVHIHLFNNSDKRVTFNTGDKVARMIVVPVWSDEPTEVHAINMNTDRGEGGFGSTGDK